MLRNPYLLKLLFAAAVGAALPACGNLAGTSKTSAVAGTDLVSANGAGAANAIASFVPAAGTYSAVPGTVQVNFNTSSLDGGGAAAVSTYSITCGGNPLAAQSVTFSAGLASVSVSLPSITGLADGTLCTFSVSISLKDGVGNFIIGQHTVNYTISSSGSVINSGGAWNEASVATNTAAVGNGSGNAFMGVAANGVALSGLLLNGGQYVNGIAGLWSNGFSSTTQSTGPVQGSSSGGFSQINCPTGYRMTGIYGHSGSYVDQIGIVCKTQDQSQTYTSGTFGGSGGNSFALNCPAGMFATDLDGMSDGYLEELYLGCR